MERIRDFFIGGLPGPGLILALGPPLALYALAAAAFVGHLRSARGVRTPYTRKILHFAIFFAAAAIQVLWGLPAVNLFGTIVALGVLYAVHRGAGFPFYEAMARPTDEPRRSLFILVPLLTTVLGGIASNILFPRFAFVGYLVCGCGDAVGEPVGTRWGRRRYTVPSLAGVPATRSIEGSLAVFAAGWAAASTGLFASGIPAPAALSAGMGCALAGALVEAFSQHGLDNLTVQMAASAAATLLLKDQ